MYLLSTILNTPPPPIDTLLFRREEVPAEGVAIEPKAAEKVGGETSGKARRKAKAKEYFY